MSPAKQTEEQRGGEFVTLYEAERIAERIMTAALAEYERRVVDPRHQETQRGQQEIKDDVQTVKLAVEGQNELIQRGTGMVILAGILGSLASFIWIVIQISHFVMGHPITLGTN